MRKHHPSVARFRCQAVRRPTINIYGSRGAETTPSHFNSRCCRAEDELTKNMFTLWCFCGTASNDNPVGTNSTTEMYSGHVPGHSVLRAWLELLYVGPPRPSKKQRSCGSRASEGHRTTERTRHTTFGTRSKADGNPTDAGIPSESCRTDSRHRTAPLALSRTRTLSD